MHEWGIAYNLAEKIITVQKKNNLAEVKRARIILGRGLGITKDEFLFCLKTITKDESLKNCEFVVEEDDSGLASLDFVEGE